MLQSPVLTIYANHTLAPSIAKSGRSLKKNELVLPLSSDHLITLVTQNVYRALMTNMVLCSLPNIFTCSVTDRHGNSITALPLPSAVPPSLYPTELQRSVKHPVYVDIFPLPRARDSVIRSLGTFDENALLADVLPALAQAKGVVVAGQGDLNDMVDEEQRGLLVWGDPWQASSWEMTPFFLKKWGWMYQDCVEEVLSTTNYWRRLRGERALSREIVKGLRVRGQMGQQRT